MNNKNKKKKQRERKSHDNRYKNAGLKPSNKAIIEMLVLWAITAILITGMYIWAYSFLPEYAYWNDLIIPVNAIVTTIAVALIGILALIIRERWLRWH